jgi:1-aminocyclopropane-1-carboxylate deaminase/D-cysteine desulfhydrase-like pyridoxal-dependent ACC family enzyme
VDQKNLAVLRNKLAGCPQCDYPVHSRIHSLKSFATVSTGNFFVKREDELSFGISGSKIRKYRTLIPHLLETECREAIVVGSAYSNNVLSIAQVLIENGILPTFFLRGPKPVKQTGNFLFLQMMADENSIHWIEGKERARMEDLAFEYAASRQNATVIPEGASLFSGFLGALTLPLDILKNEEACELSFDHVFVDAGTGYTAAAVLLGFAFLRKSTQCHVLLLAEEEVIFIQKLHALHGAFEQWLGVECPFPTRFQCQRSPVCPSFGSTNQLLFKFMIETAKSEGFFLDPIYSAKLFYHAKHTQETLEGNVLVIHSGGAWTLSGFQEQIASQIV